MDQSVLSVKNELRTKKSSKILSTSAPETESSVGLFPKLFQQDGVHINEPKTDSELGYRSLAYHPQNYAVACKTCNTVVKKSYFPIANRRQNWGSGPNENESRKAIPNLPGRQFWRRLGGSHWISWFIFSTEEEGWIQTIPRSRHNRTVQARWLEKSQGIATRSCWIHRKISCLFM